MPVTALRRSRHSGRHGPGVGLFGCAILTRVSGDVFHRQGARQ
ncbi:UNVERIFIED_ORG: hypothetical protein J2Y81_002063 [Paraburkholderia sediminicola]|uniref:Uncharacterized protein n=1 Tax=Paraburkholderia aspalathi TaxID=1324617 RepID=A0A1I7CGI4_9BURK|nr:hypothetical protein [Paraburkholderia sediminicola]CAE6799436.1 hypothetical protein R75465_04870 [Paraburkholderia aspalathi]CAE6813545.1 hypothetical protein R69746_05728 [Paraburkholderia aspalathi]SFT98531.1 hypothetical protein SAMN05192563_1006225 [Paraburkholderia aspalathi]